MKLFFILLSTFCSIAQAKESTVEEYSIKVRLYRGHPGAESFAALFKLSKIVAIESANGFIKRTVIKRDTLHSGATYCLYIDRNLFEAEKELSRIISLVSSLKPEGQIIDYEVSNPSDCLNLN